MAAMAAAREAIDCSMRAWLALPIALPSADAAALAACTALSLSPQVLTQLPEGVSPSMWPPVPITGLPLPCTAWCWSLQQPLWCRDLGLHSLHNLLSNICSTVT